MGKRKYLVFSNDVVPARDGVYQRELFIDNKHRWTWNRYEKGIWYTGYFNFDMAKFIMFKSHYQVCSKSGISTLRWRGLAEQPK